MADWVTDIYEAILLRSIKDLRNSVDYSRPGYSRHIGPEVREWFASDAGFDDGELFSFACCCSVLNTCHHKVRRWLSPWMTPLYPDRAVDKPVDRFVLIFPSTMYIKPKAYRLHITMEPISIYREAV